MTIRECVITRVHNRKREKSVALRICAVGHPLQRFTTIRWCYIVQALNRKRVRDIRAIYKHVLDPTELCTGMVR